jgi:rare lipoprotein A
MWRRISMLRRPLIWALSSAMSVALAACGGAPPAPSPAPVNQSLYKVGAPYEIDGIWYYPSEDLSYDETGIASWYGEQFHRHNTANGEVFDLNALTAAHRTLPMPSVVQVTNLDNGRSIKLRINDRGPFARGRIIDVSRRAAQLLGFEARGTAKVRVQLVVGDSLQVAAIAKHHGGGADTVPPIAAAPRESVAAAALPPPPGTKTAENKSEPPPAAPAEGFVVGSNLPEEAPPLPEQVSVVPVKPTQIYIQAGAFIQSANAHGMEGKLRSLGSPVKVTRVAVNGVAIYRVRLGPIPNVVQADSLLERMVSNGVPEARIVVD